MSSTQYVRDQGWGVGTQIRGTNARGHVVDLEITAIGRSRVLCVRLGDQYESEESWFFDERTWVVLRKRAPATRAMRGPTRTQDSVAHFEAALEYGVSPLVGGWKP